MTVDYVIPGNHGFKDPASIPEGYVFRDQRGRYPWWVKSVDRITTQVDLSVWQRKTTDRIMKMVFGPDQPEMAARLEKSRPKMIQRMKDEVPGHRLQDFALHYASETYFAAGVDLFKAGMILEFLNIRKTVGALIHPPEELGMEPWKGTELEASAMLEKAAVHLGASQVGFTALNPYNLEHMVHIDSEVEKIKSTEDGRILVPESMRYVVVLVGQVPFDAAARSPSQIGDAADRAGYENRGMVVERMINFIRGLGYKAKMIPGFMPPAIPLALMAGLGEMGRTNRLISPLYGGAVRLEAILTDLPLALDKPIDFGLQKFCRGCKKCAKSCPAGAISMDDEPTWEPYGDCSTGGKKVYWDNYDKCSSFTGSMHLYCAACLASCPWNKDDKTVLHSVVKAVSAKAPALSPFMVFMDDLFGYGLAPKEKLNDWWELDLPPKGLRSF